MKKDPEISATTSTWRNGRKRRKNSRFHRCQSVAKIAPKNMSDTKFCYHQQNNFLISAFEEQKRKQFIDVLKNIVKPKINERVNLLMQKFAVNK